MGSSLSPELRSSFCPNAGIFSSRFFRISDVMKIKLFAACFLSMLLCQSLFAKEFSIKLKVNNLPKTQAILLQHKGDKSIPADTVQVTAGGVITFTMDDTSLPGMYSIDVHDMPVWTFIYSRAKVEAEIDLGAKPETARIISSDDNTRYYRFVAEQSQILAQIDVVRSVLDQYPTGELFYAQAAAEFSRLQARQDSVYRSAMKGTQPSLSKTYIAASRQVVVPLSIPRLLQQEYAREHYFDYMPLNDTMLIYSNIYTSKLLKYYALFADSKQTKAETQHAYIAATDTILTHVSAFPEMLRFTANFLMDGFEAIGQEAVADAIAQFYSSANSCESADGLKGIDLKSYNRTKLRVGTDAPQFSLDDNARKFSYHAEPERTVLLVFWATWCPHCTETMPQVERKLKEFASKGVEIVTVSLDTDTLAWRDYAAKNGMAGFANFCPAGSWESAVAKQYAVYATPTFYVLSGGKIAAKPIDLADVPDALRNILKK